MKITLVMVVSLDGKITKGNNPDTHIWNSKEDQELFSKTLNSFNLLVMGKNTYEAAKENMELTPEKRRIILTSNPNAYKELEIKGQLEFTNEPPSQLVQRLEQEGYHEMLLLGGGQIANSFYKEKLVNELWLTLEPAVFGEGNQMAGNGAINVTFNLLEVKQLNSQGTLFMRYSAIY